MKGTITLMTFLVSLEVLPEWTEQSCIARQTMYQSELQTLQHM